jgi:hypothetical protein
LLPGNDRRAAPKNLVHLVVQNGTYEANGEHPIPNPKIDFATMARAAGYPHAHEFSDLATFRRKIEALGCCGRIAQGMENCKVGQI